MSMEPSDDTPVSEGSIDIDSVIAKYIDCIDRGEVVDEDHWIKRYPQLADGLREFFSAERAMEHSKHPATKAVFRNKTRQNFLKIRCPHCRNPTDIAVDTPASEILCDNCGGHFTWATDSVETKHASKISSVAHFEMIERLGIGGFGTVWKARDTELDRVVAVKIPRRGGMTEDETEKFFREARAAAQLNHPNIVTVHEVGRDDDTIYIVSDFVRGITLEDWLTGDRPSVREAAEICNTIALAVEHAHQRGVIHRDLTPRNVMIDCQGEPHLLDFGLARREHADVTMTMDGAVMGTPGYMSPEQAAGSAHLADRRTDVYSIGVLLFRLLTGERPFRGNDQMLLYQVMHKPAPSPRKLNNCIPRDLETICLKCMEKKPELRYQTAADVAEELKRFLENKPIKARPVSALTKFARFCNRNRAATFFVALAVVSSLAVAGVLLYMINDSIIKDKVAVKYQVLWEKSSYNETMRNASRYWSNDQAGLAISLLEDRERCPPGYREFTWEIMHEFLRRYERSLNGHSAKVRQVAVSLDGRKIASASEDGTTRIWDANTGEQQFVLSNGSELANDNGLGTDRVFSLAFSPDGNALATGSQRSVCLWDYRTGTRLAQLPVDYEENGITGTAFSPDGRSLVCCGSYYINIWNMEKSRPTLLKRIRPGPKLLHIGWSSDGKLVAAAGSDHKIYLYQTEDWSLRNELAGAGSWVSGVHFSPDSQSLAGASWDRKIYLWVLDPLHMAMPIVGHTNWVRCVAFSPDGRYLVSGGEDRKIRLWDAKSGTPIGVAAGHSDTVFGVAFSPDGKHIVSGSADGTVKTWLLTSFLRRPPELDDIPTDVVHADGPDQLFFALRDGTVSVFDREEYRTIRTISASSSGLTSVSCSADGTKLASIGDKDRTNIRLWNLDQSERPVELNLPYGNWKNGEPFYCVEVSRDGSLLAIGGDETVSIIDFETQKILHRSEAHQNQVVQVAFSRDGKMLASACRDGSIGLWDMDSQKMTNMLIGHRSDVTTVSFSADGSQLASASADRTVRIWDIATKKNTAIFYGHRGPVDKVRWSPDDKSIISVGAGELLFWDIELQQERARLQSSDFEVTSFDVSPTKSEMFTLIDGTNHWADWSHRRAAEAAKIDIPGSK